MPEILNIGFDLEEIRRFKKYLDHFDEWEVLLKDVFSPAEVKHNLAHHCPEICFTLCFCFKEALSKALGKSWMNAGIDWKEMEIIFENKEYYSPFTTQVKGEVSAIFRAIGGKKLECEVLVEGTVAGCKVMISQ